MGYTPQSSAWKKRQTGGQDAPTCGEAQRFAENLGAWGSLATKKGNARVWSTPSTWATVEISKKGKAMDFTDGDKTRRGWGCKPQIRKSSGSQNYWHGSHGDDSHFGNVPGSAYLRLAKYLAAILLDDVAHKTRLVGGALSHWLYRHIK